MPDKEEYWSDPEKHRAKTRQYAKDHPEWKRRTGREWMRKKRARQTPDERAADTKRQKLRDPIGHLLRIARTRAEAQNIPFNLERDDITIPDVCPVFGWPFDWGSRRRGWRNMTAPSLDRIKPQLGYVKGNVRVISIRANHLKGNGTISEFEAVLAYMKREGCNYDLEQQEDTLRYVEANVLDIAQMTLPL